MCHDAELASRRSPPRRSPTPSRRRRRRRSISRIYAVEDWVTLGDLLGDGALRLPAVLHPLRAERLLRLDRGDRDQLPDRRGLHRLGDVRARCRGTSRSTSSTATCRPRWRACSRPLVDLVRIAFFAYARHAGLALHRASIGDERDDHDRPAARTIVFYAVLARLRADVRALRPGRCRSNWRQRLFRPRASRSLRRPSEE